MAVDIDGQEIKVGNAAKGGTDTRVGRVALISGDTIVIEYGTAPRSATYQASEVDDLQRVYMASSPTK